MQNNNNINDNNNNNNNRIIFLYNNFQFLHCMHTIKYSEQNGIIM